MKVDEDMMRKLTHQEQCIGAINLMAGSDEKSTNKFAGDAHFIE